VPRTRLALGGAAQESPRWGEVFGALSSQGWTTIALSCVNGLAISYAGLRVQQLVTATTFMVLTNVNKARAPPPPPPLPRPLHTNPPQPRPRCIRARCRRSPLFAACAFATVVGRFW